MTHAVPAPLADVVARRTSALPYAVRRIWVPEVYQGGSKRDDYFEGWYLKCVDGDQANPIAFIPGVSHDRQGGTSHSFVQVVRPGGSTSYLRYPVEEFAFDPRRFEITVGPNRFSAEGVVLDIARDEIDIKGELRFGPWRPWPVSLRTPGAMGWYRFVPRMECYHAACSLDHSVDGLLSIDGADVSFGGGRGYAEKDWGCSFPSSWVWAQSNHFPVPGASVTVSVAKIPWMGGSFVGFIAGVLLGQSLYRFTTYTGARLTAFHSDARLAEMTFEDHQFRLDVTMDAVQSSSLKAPSHGRMIARADEALGATIDARLVRIHDGEVLLDGQGLHAGAEVMDEKDELAAGVWHHPAADD